MKIKNKDAKSMDIVQCPKVFGKILSQLEVINHEGTVWLAAKDVGNFGSETHPQRSIQLHVRDKHQRRYRDFEGRTSAYEGATKWHPRIQDKIFINERGLIEYAIRLNHPLLEDFQDWVLDVLLKELKPQVKQIKFTTSESLNNFLPNELVSSVKENNPCLCVGVKCDCDNERKNLHMILQEKFNLTKDDKHIDRSERAWVTRRENTKKKELARQNEIDVRDYEIDVLKNVIDVRDDVIDVQENVIDELKNVIDELKKKNKKKIPDIRKNLVKKNPGIVQFFIRKKK